MSYKTPSSLVATLVGLLLMSGCGISTALFSKLPSYRYQPQDQAQGHVQVADGPAAEVANLPSSQTTTTSSNVKAVNLLESRRRPTMSIGDGDPGDPAPQADVHHAAYYQNPESPTWVPAAEPIATTPIETVAGDPRTTVVPPVQAQVSSRQGYRNHGPALESMEIANARPKTPVELLLELQAENQQLKNRLAELTRDLATSRQDLAALRETNLQWQSRYDSLFQQMTTAQNELQVWKTKYTQLGKSVQSSAERRQKRIDELTNAIELLESMIGQQQPPTNGPQIVEPQNASSSAQSIGDTPNSGSFAEPPVVPGSPAAPRPK